MGMRRLTNKARIEAFLRRNPELHIYSLGDLDDYFWPDTTWYGWEEAGEIGDLVLLYTGSTLPTVVGISEQPPGIWELLRAVCPLLPERFSAHLSPRADKAFEPTHRITPHGPHYKMGLHDATRAGRIDCSAVVRLTRHDLDDLLELYGESYPGNWFDPRMLETGQYFGLRLDGGLVSVAGVHVYSRQYRVAAIGNVVTQTAGRNRGYGRLVMARLCQSLLESTDYIGLNVKADNDAALACYKGLGFETVARYGEFTLTRTI